ncbi:undecaprenyl-diphosphate phosphatase [Candidatus Woesearchaeota archaeon]|nr:undecaprenyl-diphosphate phosphatase [Candidatus Woesearchaeota archaeon]
MTTILQAIILGLIQGITEWLPVSSSGHLVIFQQLFRLTQDNIIFDLFVHIGSLLVVLLVFWEQIKQVTLSFFIKSYSKYRKIAYFVILGTIPTALIGYFFQDFFESMFSTLIPVGSALLVTGFVLFFCERLEKNKSINSASALTVGAVQGLAIMPGISRSGSTIAAALFFGVKKDEAVNFSFLLFIPAILGASVLQLSKIQSYAAVEWGPIAIGTLIAVIAGYLSLKLLLIVVKNKRLKLFSYYCWLDGIAVIIAGFYT